MKRKATIGFLKALFERSQAPVLFASLANDRAQTRRIPPRHLISREVDRLETFVARWDQPERALYFCVSALRPGAWRRAKDTLSELVCLHADLDCKNIDASQAQIKRASEALPLRPQLVVSSGHGFYCYWLLQQPLVATSENIARIEATLRRLAEVLAGDPAVCECARLMRLPGSHNTKNGGWIAVKLIKRRKGRHHLERIEAWLATAKPVLQPVERQQERKSIDSWEKLAAAQIIVAPIDVEQRLAEMQYG